MRKSEENKLKTSLKELWMSHDNQIIVFTPLLFATKPTWNDC
jgi:hypothetical protein